MKEETKRPEVWGHQYPWWGSRGKALKAK